MFRFFRFLILALALYPMAAMAVHRVNINTAGVTTLQHVKGINTTARARAIVRYRQTHGRFVSVNDLIRVPGISAGRLNTIRPYVTVGKPKYRRHYGRSPAHRHYYH